MRRLRTSFALLALLLLVPLMVLLTRTFQSLERERDARHQAVARRIFDEAERALTAFLSEEEARPPEQYFRRLPSGTPSPLTAPPKHSFVIDYFRIDEAGSVHSLQPERVAELRALMSEASRERVSRKRKDTVGRLEADDKLAVFGDRAAEGLAEEEADLQRPGSTRAVQKVDLLQRPAAVPAADDDEAKAGKGADSYSSYRVLEQLNRSSRGRAQTASKAEAGRATAPAAATPARAEVSRDASPAEAIVQEAIDRTFETSVALRTRLDRSPMAGVAIDEDRLILYRTIIIPGEGSFQQGLLLDLGRFADWIEERVLGESGLSPFIELDLRSVEHLGAAPQRDEKRFVYDHRFSEPFEALGARLSLESLPDAGGSTNVYAMALLLIVVSTLGMWAMYRRVAVAVHFAERRSNFAAAVSHELKTPLTAIRMYGEMLRDGMVPDEAKRQEYYRTITSEAERLTRLINNVLEFSKLEKRTRELAIDKGPIDSSLREVIRILEPHAHSRGFTVSLELEAGLPDVRFEPDALQQILFNLIDNALKYADDAPRKEIRIDCRREGDGVVITVRDFGSGVAPEHRPHLFEPFYRGESELTRRTKGTGIGLALVKGLAEEMSGEIAAHNAADGGFEVELRLRS